MPRPWDLLPAAMFLAGTILLYRNPYRLTSALGASLPWVAGVNAACHLMASQSAQLLDAPALAAQVLNCVSYMILLGGTLVDNVRLFGQVRHRAISDSLTGLANYRRFIELLQGELERSGRTNRHFSVLLMDLDKLKEINDRYGHQTGTRAICRVALAGLHPSPCFHRLASDVPCSGRWRRSGLCNIVTQWRSPGGRSRRARQHDRHCATLLLREFAAQFEINNPWED